MFTRNYLRWVFLLLLCSMVHATLPAQTFQVAGGIPYFPAYNNTAAVTLSPIPPGAVIYDKSQGQLQLYTGSAWVSLCSANVPSTSNISTAFRIMKGIPVLSVTSLSTTATAGATYLNTAGSVRVGDGSAWNTLSNYMNKTNVTTTSPARMGAVAGSGSALVIPVLSSPPTVTAAGAAYFDKTSADLKVYNGSSWNTLSCVVPWACGDNLTIVHTAGAVAPESKTVTYGTTTMSGTGTLCWITRNLGASSQAGSAWDASGNAAGWYFQFNRIQGYSYYSSRSPSYWNSNGDPTTATWLAAQDPCTNQLGAVWHLATVTNYQNISLFWSGSYSSNLKIHHGGRLNGSGNLELRGSVCQLWLPGNWGNNTPFALSGSVSDNYSMSNSFGLSSNNALPVRCVRN